MARQRVLFGGTGPTFISETLTRQRVVGASVFLDENVPVAAVSATLTGASATGAAGSLSITETITPTGVSVTGAPGTVSGQQGGALVGVSGTGASGSLAIAETISVTSIGTAAGTSGTLSVTVSSTVPAGSTVFVCINDTTTGTLTTPTDSASNTYHLAYQANDTTNGYCAALYYAYNVGIASSGSVSYALSTAGTAYGGEISVFYATGLLTTDPLDTPTKATATANSGNPSVTMAAAPAVASSLLVATVSSNAVHTITQPSGGWAAPPTPATQSTTGVITGGTLVSSSQLTYNPTGVNDMWAVGIAAFKPASASGVSASATGVSAIGTAGTATTPISFPASPTNGQVYSPGGSAPNYVYNASVGAWQVRDVASTSFIANPTFTGGLFEQVVAISSNTINLSQGSVFTQTISGATTLTVSNVPAAGIVAFFLLELTNPSTNVTWWSNIRWPLGVAPTLSTTGVDVLGFYTTDGGNNWRGLLLGKAFA
jgi:hypothetical protein